jgi:mRNA interferase YafQ
MRRIEPTSAFKRDYKRVKATPKHRDIDSLLSEVLKQLAIDLALPERHRDHSLTGDWKDHRDCHVKPDLVLIYPKPNDEVLQLVRLGSHAELGL